MSTHWAIDTGCTTASFLERRGAMEYLERRIEQFEQEYEKKTQ